MKRPDLVNLFDRKDPRWRIFLMPPTANYPAHPWSSSGVLFVVGVVLLIQPLCPMGNGDDLSPKSGDSGVNR